jgi:hypothetical protein
MGYNTNIYNYEAVWSFLIPYRTLVLVVRCFILTQR